MADSFQSLVSLFESAPDLMFVQELGAGLVRVNAAFERITGYGRANLRLRTFLDLLAPHCRRRVEHCIRTAGGGQLAVTLITAQGDAVDLELHLNVLPEEGVLQGIGRDLTERARTESQLLQKTRELARFSRDLQLLHQLSNTNFAAIDDLCTSYLESGCEIFGTRFGILLRTNGEQYVVGDLPSDELAGCMQEIVGSGQTITSCETSRFSLLIGTSISIDDRVLGTIGFWREREQCEIAPHPQGVEIIELMAKRIAIAIHQRELADELAHQASHDALTGLPNRLRLMERLNRSLEHAKATDAPLALVFIDLDRFKQINDTLGHRVGDVLLQQMSTRLANCMTENDTLARMGGDEFTAILSSPGSKEEVIRMVKRMLSSVRRPCVVDGLELFVTASMGISFFPKDGKDAAVLLRHADTAMYTAKNRGRNDFHCFSMEATGGALERLELENSLRRALEKRELKICYQPQVEIHGALSGLEVLLVWDHPKLGRVSPKQFIPIAEESGMIVSIGSWVLRQACRQAAEWLKKGYRRLLLSVNVSALQLAQSDFVELVANTLEETGLPSGALELELTESVVVRDMEQSARRMSELRALGVRIAIDDFGTGYSSLNYLRRLPVDTLKIDQSFVQDMELSQSTLPLVNTIVTLAHNMGLSVTAEGVETARQFELVQKASCDKAQGHYFGNLLNPEDIEELIRRDPLMLPNALTQPLATRPE